MKNISEIRKNKYFGLTRPTQLLLFIPILVSLASLYLAGTYEDLGGETLPYALLIMIMTAVAAVSVFFKAENFRSRSYIAYFIFAFAPPASFFLLESMIRDPFGEMKWKVMLLNIAFFYIISLFLFFLTKNTRISVLFCTVFAAICGIAEHYVLIFRDAPIFPWDLASLGVAATVVDNYEFTVSYQLAASVSALMMITVFGLRFNGRLDLSCFSFSSAGKIRRSTEAVVRSVACLLLASVFGGYVYYVNLDRSYTDFGMYPYLFTPKVVYSRNGFTVAFLSMLRYVNVEKPEDYSSETLEEIADIGKQHTLANNPDTSSDTDIVSPNIIVIMNEAFSDLSIYTDFATNQDYMPFLNSLTENTVKGDLHVSVLGGNTANTEFEFLTGCSMAFLPTGSIPYQQYIKDDIPSLASQLDQLGYDTLAVHPYVMSGWNRNTVYPWMGFKNSVFKVNLKNYTVIRQYVSDISVYRYIVSELKDENRTDPMFVFNVTMQNHGSYTTEYANFNHFNVTATGLETDMKLSTYLSLIKKSDDAMRYLITTLEDFDEPTIVCFFGDHQPAAAVSKNLLKNYGISIDDENIEELETRYIVPFYIWANYDIEEETYEAISANYLSTLLLKTAGLPITDAQGFLWELYNEYPVITANAYMDSEGTLHTSDDKDREELLNKYAAMQYFYLFGNESDGDYGMFSYNDARSLSLIGE